MSHVARAGDWNVNTRRQTELGCGTTDQHDHKKKREYGRVVSKRAARRNDKKQDTSSKEEIQS